MNKTKVMISQKQ